MLELWERFAQLKATLLRDEKNIGNAGTFLITKPSGEKKIPSSLLKHKKLKPASFKVWSLRFYQWEVEKTE